MDHRVKRRFTKELLSTIEDNLDLLVQLVSWDDALFESSDESERDGCILPLGLCLR